MAIPTISKSYLKPNLPFPEDGDQSGNGYKTPGLNVPPTNDAGVKPPMAPPWKEGGDPNSPTGHEGNPPAPYPTTAKPAQKWKRNENFPLMPWDLSSKIGVIQTALNLPPVQRKGYFGNVTINALKQAGFDVTKGIDENMYNKILTHFGLNGNGEKQQAPPMDVEPGTLQESKKKIKFLLNYDSSRTLFENEEVTNKTLTEQGNDFATGAVAGMSAKPVYNAVKSGINYLKNIGTKAGASAAANGAKVASVAAPTFTSTSTVGAAAAESASVLTTAEGAAAVSAVSAGETTAVVGSTFLGLSTATVLTGGIALAVVATGALIYWLSTSGDSNDKVKKLFDYCSTNRDKISKIPRGLSDNEITSLSDRCYDDIQGIGTNDKDLSNVFQSLQTLSDFQALIDVFGKERGNLYDWIKGDMDSQSDWEYIYRPLRNLVNDSLAVMKKEVGAGAGAGAGAQIPTELGDAEGVKKFQDWLDIRYKGWHDKYGTLDKNVQRGYGTYGPRTTAAWNKYKTEYLGGGSTSLNRPEFTQNVANNTKPLTPRTQTVQGNRPQAPIAGLQTKR